MNQFTLILQDNPETGQLDIAGCRAPEAFAPNSPAHIVGRFLQQNFEQVIIAAKAEWDIARRIGAGASEQAEDAKIILPAQMTLEGI